MLTNNIPQHLAWLQPGTVIAIDVSACQHDHLPPGTKFNTFPLPTYALAIFNGWYSFRGLLNFNYTMLHNAKVTGGMNHSSMAISGHCPCASCVAFGQAVAKQ